MSPGNSGMMSLVDTSEEFKNETRMYLTLTFAADSADGVTRHPQKMMGRSVRSFLFV